MVALSAGVSLENKIKLHLLHPHIHLDLFRASRHDGLPDIESETTEIVFGNLEP